MVGMKKALLALSLLALVGCDDPTGGGKLAITKHENGKTASRGYVITNAVSDEPIKVGDWVYYYEDGQKEKQGSYLEDQMHATWTFWLPGGSEPWTAEYKNGEGSKNGRFTLTSDEIRDRNIQAQKANGASEEALGVDSQSQWPHSAVLFYRLGLEHGPYESVYKNGQKSEEGTYKDGKEEGVCTFWYKNGQKSAEGTYKDGKPEGVYTKWHGNGQKLMGGTYKDGEKEGVWTGWHNNGQKWTEVTYKGGKMEGVWTMWNENGQKLMDHTYKNGKFVK